MQPIVWIVLLLLFSILSKSSKNSKRFLFGALLTLVIFSNPFLYHEIERAWEVETMNLFSEKDTADVAIVLGGMLKTNMRSGEIEFHESADRILNLLPLYFEGRVRKILISGGSGSLLKEELEADVLSNYLISIGVNSRDILKETKSRNTYENAKYSTELIKKNKNLKTVLLSTSAIHMKRSLLCFNKQGLDVIPFSVDRAESRTIYPDELLLPKASILSDWYQLIHEWVGVLTYKIAGYC
ncbi:MAG: YdcF family protein [Vicingaceae bacterium]